MYQEVLRWQSVAPLGTKCPLIFEMLGDTLIPGLPHLLMEDDEYKGHRIPKGSVVFPNIWYVAFYFLLELFR